VDRLFLDPNVLFSAAYRTHAGIGRLWELKDVELVTSTYAAEEAAVILADEEQRERLRRLLGSVEVVVGHTPLPSGVELPEKDRPILQAALHANTTHLLTGDKQHFGRYYGEKLGGVLVLSPAQYLEHRRRSL
jgi:uncharacterized protein